jgi:hypothetical protein
MNNSHFAVDKYYLNHKNDSNRFQPFDKHLSKLTKQRLLNVFIEVKNLCKIVPFSKDESNARVFKAMI